MFFFAGKTDSEATLKVGSKRNSSQKWFVVETFQIEELKMTQKFFFQHLIICNSSKRIYIQIYCYLLQNMIVYGANIEYGVFLCKYLYIEIKLGFMRGLD